MSAETADVLRRAKALIATPEKWCWDAFAMDSRGRSVVPGDALACRHCALAAVAVATNVSVFTAPGTAAYQALEREVPTAGYDPDTADSDLLEWFNDRSRHRDVVAVFDRAIAAEEVAP